MSGGLSERSNLIDVTYTQLHSVLSGHIEGTSVEQIKDYIFPRLDQLKNISDPFGKPSDASHRKVTSGSVTLSDGVVLRVEEADKEFIFAISAAFNIDEVHSLILLRAFLYNQGLPSSAQASTDNASLADELVEAITPFYFAERLSILRVFIPLFRAKENISEPLHEIALSIIPKLLPDGQQFTKYLLAECGRKFKENVPTTYNNDPKKATRWAKQNSREQLVLLEVLFWTLWGSADCDGPTVEQIFRAAYGTNLGMDQQNATLLLDEEGMQLARDKATLWIIITIEVLELETIADQTSLEITDEPTRTRFYISSPDSLTRIHELVISHGPDQYACTYLAWTFVVSRLSSTGAQMKTIPNSYRKFYESLLGHTTSTYSKDREPAHVVMTRTCLEPEAGLFRLMLTMLTTSPLFVTASAWRTGSTITDPNAIAFRSVFKGLVIALVELVPVELIPEFDAFVEVWIALFGRSETESVAGICSQYWTSDWQQGLSRRAILDVSRTRFPVQCGPLIRLLRSMTASGFLETDPLSTADHSQDARGLTEERELCAKHVFYFLDKLPTFSQVIPASACTGAHAIYEKQVEQYSSSSTAGVTYTNLYSIRLPGDSLLHAGSKGRLLSSDGGDFLVITWQHEHSGWKLLLDILAEYVHQLRSGTNRPYKRTGFDGTKETPEISLSIRDLGIEMDGNIDEILITDILDTVRSVIQGNPSQGEQLMQSLEAVSGATSASDSSPPDLIQLTVVILEEALTRYNVHARVGPPSRLVTSALSVLAAILAVPSYSVRVWIYLRSTSALFGSERAPGSTPAALAAERVTGHYSMTLALLHLVQQLCEEASLLMVSDDTQVRKFKDEVLLRAVRFVHAEIWLEHSGWKYAQLGDRFEIGRRVSSLYFKILQYTTTKLEEGPFPKLSQTILDILLFRASTLSINPLVSAISAGTQMLGVLYTSRRFGDARRLIFLLESHLRLIRAVLHRKCHSELAMKPSLLEQALCAQVTGGAASHDPHRSKVNAIDALAFYAKERDAGQVVPLEAVRVLSSLCSSLSMSRPTPSTIAGHLTDPEGVVATFVRIMQHPYDELSLRYSLWNFITNAMDKEPALASLFIAGQFRTPAQHKGKAKETEDGTNSTVKVANAIDVARDTVSNWEQMWESNPQLLASVLRFLVVVWQHGLEHKAMLQSTREDSDFWKSLVSLACTELGPIPDHDTETYVVVDGVRRSNLHDATAEHCYRIVAKSAALRVIGLDLGIHLQSQAKNAPPSRPISLSNIELKFKSQDEFTDLISEATPSSYVPDLYDQLSDRLKASFPTLSLTQLESQQSSDEREYGDEFTFSMSMLRSRLRAYSVDHEMGRNVDSAERLLSSINLNLSLTQTQSSLTDSWQFLLRQVVPYLGVITIPRPILLSIAVSVSFDIMRETRQGDMAATIHGTRLSLLVALLQLTWFSNSDQTAEVKTFIELFDNVRGIILNEYQPLSKSIQRAVTVPFHRQVLQILYVCVKNARRFARRPGALNAEQRMKITLLVDATLGFVIDALRVIFMSARGRADLDVDKDMELLVAVFEQYTRSDINPSSTSWLVRCQETDIVRASLDLYAHIDLVGVSDLSFLVSNNRSLYASHILTFHMALASIPSAAERFASDGVLSAYTNCSISVAASAGLIDEVLPELPGQRSPAHQLYCNMLAVISGVIAAMGRNNHYFDAEACGLVQVYGEQISRALSWTTGAPITFPLLEEMEQVVNLFRVIAQNTPPSMKPHPMVENVLRVFTPLALHLIQQLNYAITHPNHLASLLEPVTTVERILLEKDSSSSADPLKRPVIAHVMHRLFQLSSNIICTLICVSKADVVLIGEPSDWPIHEALVLPHSKVVVGEAASIGTLLELGNGTLDMLRHLSNLPSSQSLVPAGVVHSSKIEELDARQGVATARRNLEAILVYAVTQLAMWLSKPEFDAPSSDMDEEQTPEKSDTKERRARASVSLGERIRRGMAGEVAADLQTLLNKAKPVIAKSDSVLGTGYVDLTSVLATFLQEHVASSAS